MSEAFDFLDLLAGFSGALLAILSQARVSYLRMLASLTIGSVSAMYGGPALDAWADLPDALERFYALLIGLTAQAYLIPGVLDAAALLARLPSQWIKRKLGDRGDE